MSQATKHTAIISDPASMWSKLAWDADCFRDIQTNYPDEKEPLAYAAINVGLAASSLQDWTKKCLQRGAEESDRTWDEDAFFTDLRAAVPEQSTCAAIANTSKHMDFHQRRWVNGEVLLVYEEGNENVPSGYVLYHVIAHSHGQGFAVNRFDALCRNWWKFLTARGLTDGRSDMPEWRSNKLNRIFRAQLGR